MKSSDLNKTIDTIHRLTKRLANKKFEDEGCQMYFIQAMTNLKLARTSMRIAALKLYLEE